MGKTPAEDGLISKFIINLLPFTFHPQYHPLPHSHSVFYQDINTEFVRSSSSRPGGIFQAGNANSPMIHNSPVVTSSQVGKSGRALRGRRRESSRVLIIHPPPPAERCLLHLNGLYPPLNYFTLCIVPAYYSEEEVDSERRAARGGIQIVSARLDVRRSSLPDVVIDVITFKGRGLWTLVMFTLPPGHSRLDWSSQPSTS